MLTATVSGSFHRHMEAITIAVQDLGCSGRAGTLACRPSNRGAARRILVRGERSGKISEACTGSAFRVYPRGEFLVVGLP